MKWFIADGSQSFGPYSSEQLRAFAKAGKVTPKSYVRTDEQEEWIEASRVNGLFEGVLTIAPPVAVAVAAPPTPVPQAQAVEPVRRSSNSVAFLFLALGACITLYHSLLFDTTVETFAGKRVHNIGLMNERMVGLAVGIGMSILGAILKSRR